MSTTPKWCDEGEIRVINILFGAQAVDAILYLGLYKNSVEPVEAAIVADLTEPTGFGYTRKALGRGSWTIVGALATFTEQTFLAQGGAWGDIYGYFITTSSSGTGGKLIALEHLGTAYPVEDGKGIKITPKISCA